VTAVEHSALEPARYQAGKNHAFCPRARTALGVLAESAAGDFRPEGQHRAVFQQWSGIWRQTRDFVDRFIEGTAP
jgi:hypothetical protein